VQEQPLAELLALTHAGLPVPEENPGFAAIIGNPPFQGGKKISTVLGTDYREYLGEIIAKGKKGSADLVAFFFLRAHELMQTNGMLGLIATNTIAQGDTREVSLDQMVDKGATIVGAIPSQPWPGGAALEVAHLWIRGGAWNGEYVLDNKLVAGISPFLTISSTTTGNPFRLVANSGKSFIGTYVFGTGFVLEPDEADQLMNRNPKNKEVLFPYLNGEDINSRPDQSASRWVINFFDWDLERSSLYPECLQILTDRVKPQRDAVVARGKQIHEYDYWKFWDRRPLLYNTIKKIDQVLAIAVVSRTVSFTFVPINQVFAHKLAVFAFDEYTFFAVLQSVFHYNWAWQYSSTMKADLNYSPSDCFETFPFPEKLDGLEAIGEEYHEYRRQIMLERQEGLTKTYNRFHNPVEDAADIVRLRELHVAMDLAVRDAYGWADLELDHGFHLTKQGLRYTISEAARREVLDQLLLLNHRRYAQEVAQGLHDKGAKKAKGARKAKPKDEGQLGML
jgi:hypothetical protein